MKPYLDPDILTAESKRAAEAFHVEGTSPNTRRTYQTALELANATAATFGCLRFGKLLNQPLVLSTLFCAARIAERAPWISNVRK